MAPLIIPREYIQEGIPYACDWPDTTNGDSTYSDGDDFDSTGDGYTVHTMAIVKDSN